MATAVQRSQDCLQQCFHLDAFRSSLPATSPAKSGRRKSCRSPSPPSPLTSSTKSKPRSGGRRVKVAGGKDEKPMVVKSIAKNLVTEDVTILKRGEEQPVDRRSEGRDSPAPIFSGRIGPAAPGILPKQISLVESKSSELVYAGPGFIASPAPSSLPFPASLVIKKGTDEATKGLVGLLRLGILP